MKKAISTLTLILGLLVVGLFTSCELFEDNCNCGIITESNRVEVYVRNDCSDNSTWFRQKGLKRSSGEIYCSGELYNW